MKAISIFIFLMFPFVSVYPQSKAELNTQLFNAVRSRDMEGVKKSLLAGADINARNKMGGVNKETSLMYAAASGNLPMIKLLLSKGADLYLMGDLGKTALSATAEYEMDDAPEVVSFLISQYKNPSHLKRDIADLILESARHLNKTILKYLISQKYSVNVTFGDVKDSFSDKGTTPICVAISDRRNAAEIIQLLIDAGAEMNPASKSYPPLNCFMFHATSFHLTPSEIAERSPAYQKILQILLEAKANPNIPEGSETPLMHAVKYGDIKFAEILLTYGADINAKGLYGKSVLMYAFPDKNYNRTPSKECPPEEDAMRLELLKFLVSRGARMNDRDDHGNTVIYYANKGAYGSSVKYLKKIGLKLPEADR